MKRIIISAILLTVFAATSFSQEKQKKDSGWWIFGNSKSKESLMHQRDSLQKIVDSLKHELDYAGIEISEVSDNDSIVSSFGESMLDMPVSSDSLLSIWYHQRNLSLVDDYKVDLDSTMLTSNIPDSTYLERLKKMNSFVSIPYNNIVRNHIIYYTERIPGRCEVFLGLSNYYLPIFEEILSNYGLPIELKAMAIIESWLNPVAVSRAKAKGMWQFMYGTAKRYDLTINSYVDERLDPVAAAHAAAKYLRDSYLIFGDWALAIASYNCGAGNVSKAIRRSGGAKDFWTIYPYLPRETRGYVPSFVAALYTLNYYKEHKMTPVLVQMPPHVDTIKVNKMLHFEQVSQFTGISVEELKNLNPQYIHNIIPGVEKEYILKLPYNYTGKFIENEKEIYKFNDSLYFNDSAMKTITEAAAPTSITHKVKKGETLSHIAIKYKVKVSDIQKWNNVKSTLRIGQKLTIYTTGSGPKSSSVSKSSSSSSTASNVTTTNSSTKTSTSGGFTYYTVKKGDNLWDISKKFEGVSVNDILELNGMNTKSKIFPGQKLKIKAAN